MCASPVTPTSCLDSQFKGNEGTQIKQDERSVNLMLLPEYEIIPLSTPSTSRWNSAATVNVAPCILEYVVSVKPTGM